MAQWEVIVNVNDHNGYQADEFCEKFMDAIAFHNAEVGIVEVKYLSIDAKEAIRQIQELIKDSMPYGAVDGNKIKEILNKGDLD